MSYGNTPGQAGGYGGPGYGGPGGPGYGGPGGPGYGRPPGYNPGPPPSNYLVWAILTTLFCCLPAGIVSIVYAAQVNSKWFSGDYDGAYRSSNNAKTWAIVSAIIGAIVIIIAIIAKAGSASNGAP
jgi:hypothetical protein